MDIDIPTVDGANGGLGRGLMADEYVTGAIFIVL